MSKLLRRLSPWLLPCDVCGRRRKHLTFCRWRSRQRDEWDRIRLTRGETELTFRVMRGTPIVFEQSGWNIKTERLRR